MAVSNVTRKFKFVCQGLECNSSSSSGPHYLLNLPGQTCEMLLECEKSQVFRKLTLEEAYWFPGNIKGEDKYMQDTQIMQAWVLVVVLHVQMDAVGN